VKRTLQGAALLCYFFLSLSLIFLPVTASTTQVHIIRYANDRTTIINETTVNFTWMMANLPVYGDGTTHYYHQGPVFIDDAANATHEEELRWNPAEDTNVQEKDYGAVKGTNLKDLCNLVGGISPGEEVTIKAIDGFFKNFAYKNVYDYSSRQGPMVITWSKDGKTPETGYDEGMKLIFFADTSKNPWGLHAFGNSDWRESADSKYWYYYYQGSQKYPTTTGLSVKYISEVIIYSNTPASQALPPIAGFSATVTNGSAPLSVTFTDTSTRSPTSWSWDFGDAGTTTVQNPAHTYSAAGNYSVKLVATNSGGSNTTSKTDYIRVITTATSGTVNPMGGTGTSNFVSNVATGKDLINFTVNVTNGTNPLTVQFTDTSSEPFTSWFWEFGDSQISWERNPIHTYTSNGTFSIRFSGVDARGSLFVIRSNYITVNNTTVVPLTVSFFGEPVNGIAPLTVNFTDNSSGSTGSYLWDFDNDGVIDSTDRNTTYTYTVPGLYTVNLTLSSSTGTLIAVKREYISVTKALPEITEMPIQTVTQQINATSTSRESAEPTENPVVPKDTLHDSEPEQSQSPASPAPAPYLVCGGLSLIVFVQRVIRKQR
jgi:PKD repeat protein